MWCPDAAPGGRGDRTADRAAYAGDVVFSKILRDGEGKLVRRLSKIAAAVDSLADDYTDLSDAELRRIGQAGRERVLGEHTSDHRAAALEALISDSTGTSPRTELEEA